MLHCGGQTHPKPRHAFSIWTACMQVLGGKGGGKPTGAQGQGPNIDKVQEAMDKARKIAEERLRQ